MIRHIAFIMDGNRRWAKKNGFATLYGHGKGVETIKSVITFCLKKNIENVSLYTFSIENFKRSDEEKSHLFSLILRQAKQEAVEQFLEQDIRVSFIGDRSLFPQEVTTACLNLEQKTAHCKALRLNFLFCYGGRQEFTYGVKSIVQKIKNGLLSPESISDEVVQEHMWTAGIPDPDVIIRTGGFKRLSNFLLYQSAYSELFFLDCLWPELNEALLEKTYQEFLGRKRKFGT